MRPAAASVPPSLLPPCRRQPLQRCLHLQRPRQLLLLLLLLRQQQHLQLQLRQLLHLQRPHQLLQSPRQQQHLRLQLRLLLPPQLLYPPPQQRLRLLLRQHLRLLRLRSLPLLRQQHRRLQSSKVTRRTLLSVVSRATQKPDKICPVFLCQPLCNRRDHFIALRFGEFAIDRNAEHLARDAMRNLAA